MNIEAQTPAPAPVENTASNTSEQNNTNVVSNTSDTSNISVAENEKNTEPKKDKLASRFAALSKKEKALVEKERAIKEYESKISQFQSAQENFKKDPIAALKAYNLEPHEFIDLLLLGGEKEKPKSIEDEVKSIKEEIENYKKSELEKIENLKKEQEQAEQSKLKSEFTNLIETTISNHADDFELIKEFNCINDVQELIEKVYVETNGQTIMPVLEAAKLIEEQLEEEKKHELELLSKTKKLSRLLTTNQSSLEDNNKNPEVKKISKTLTNKTAAVDAAIPKKLTREESIARAAKLLKFT